jgi:hypothetical protein
MNSALLDAGHSAFWFQGKSQHIKVEGNRIERPGFCGAYLQGIYPGDTWAGGDGDGTQGTVDGTQTPACKRPFSSASLS